jgi:DNA replication factor GINS
VIEKLRLWLLAEVTSRVLAEPPFGSYAEVAERLLRELQSQPMPQSVADGVREYVSSALLTLIELRLRKILWELGQGRVTERMTAEEERLVRPVLKIKHAGARKKSQDYVIVQFLMPHPAIITDDFLQVGPFARGDLAKLPARDAKDLEERGVVRRFLYL